MALQLFDKWRCQSLDRIIAEWRELGGDAGIPTVKRWHEAGEKFSVIKERRILAKSIFFLQTKQQVESAPF